MFSLAIKFANISGKLPCVDFRTQLFRTVNIRTEISQNKMAHSVPSSAQVSLVVKIKKKRRRTLKSDLNNKVVLARNSSNSLTNKRD